MLHNRRRGDSGTDRQQGIASVQQSLIDHYVFLR
jgi:hypothetical protein